MIKSTNNAGEGMTGWIVATTPDGPVVDLQTLEDRVLYSAGPVPVEFYQPVEIVDLACDDLGCFDSLETNFDLIADGFEALDDVAPGIDFGVETTLGAGTEIGTVGLEATHELVIVDTSVEDYQQLVEGLLSERSSERNLEVVYLTSDADGVSQISSLLATRTNLDAIHLVSHGRDGELQLGSTLLNGDNLGQFASEISGWKAGLSADADVLIYGCNVAQSDVGEDFVQELAELIEADISASSDVTGHQSLGGDWYFEYAFGVVESESAFSTEATKTWTNTLAVIAIGSGPGSSNVDMAADFFGNLLIVASSDQPLTADGDDVYLSRRDNTGADIFTNVLVNDSTAGDQTEAVVAMADSGDFVVVWTSDFGGQNNVFAKVYNSFGAVELAEFQVNDIGTTAEDAAVSMNANGEFVITWQGSGAADSDGVYAKRFNEYGEELSDVMLVNSTTIGFQGHADVALNNNGQFIVSWDSFTNTDVDTDVLFSVFNASNQIMFAETASHDAPLTYYSESSVAINDDGDFVVSATATPTDSGVLFADFFGFTVSQNVEAIAFEYDGLGNWNDVSLGVHNVDGAAGEQSTSSVAIVNGEVVVSWQGEESISGGVAYLGEYTSVFTRSFDFDGTATSGETRVGGVLAEVQESVSLVSFHDDEAWAMVWWDENGGTEQIDNAWSQSYVIENQSPRLETNKGMVVANGSAGNTISASMLNESDPDDEGVEVIYTLTADVALGELLVDGTVLNAGETFTQADIDELKLSYLHTADSGFNDSFDFSISDGGENGSTAVTGQFVIAISGFNQAPTDLSSGIDINTDDGNDVYFAVNGGAPTDLLNGLEEVTFEATFSISDVADHSTILSYNVPGDDEFSIQVRGNDRLRINVDDANYDTDKIYAQLFDGEKHHLAVSWDSAGGILQIFVDGVFSESILEVETGLVLAPDGVLVLGQEQDTLNGGFNADEVFSGTLYDVRVWDEARTEADISANYLQQFDASYIPEGLIANWQMKSLSGSGSDTVVDLVNPGSYDLTIQHVGSGGTFSNSTPVDVLNVDENVPNGQTVGYVMPTDADYNENIVEDGSFNSMEITDENFTVFGFDGSGAGNTLGEWNVVANAIDVRGTDWELSPAGGRAIDLTGGSGGTANGQGIIEQTLTTVVGHEYEISFAMSGNFTAGGTQHDLSVNVDGLGNVFSFTQPTGWSPTNLQWEEMTLKFTATSTSTVLQFEALTGTWRGAMIGDVAVVDQFLAPAGSYSYNMIDDADGRFQVDTATGEVFVLDGSKLNYEADTSHDVIIEVIDSAGPAYQESMTIWVNDINESPTVSVSGLTVIEGSAGNTITSSMLSEGDPDDDGTEVVYTLKSTLGSGTLRLGGTALAYDSTFTQQDIDNGDVTYDQNGDEAPSDSFDFELSDGGEDGATSVVGTFSIGITAVNDSPTVANSGTTVLEGSDNNTIDATMLSGADPDDSASDLTFTVTTDVVNGTLYRGITALGVSGTFTQADIEAGLITYEHDGDEPAGDSFAFSLADGGEDSSVPATGTFLINVTAVNDAPVVVNNGTTVTEGQTGHVITTAMLGENDPDDDGAGLTYTVTGVTTEGDLYLGASQLGVNGTFTQADVDGDLLTYNHGGGELTSDSFSFSLADGGEDSASPATGDFNIGVTAVNDAPTIATNELRNVLWSSSGNQITNVMLNEGDPDDDGAELTYKITADVINGTLRLGGAELFLNSEFTQADIDAGLITYDHGGSPTTTDSFDFSLSDGGEDLVTAATGTFSFQINGGNSVPEAFANVYGVAHGGSTTFGIEEGILYNDFDSDGDTLAVSVINDVDNGTLTLEADGTFTYEHNGTATNSDFFVYEVNDGNGGMAQATVTIHIDDNGFVETGEFQVNDDLPASPWSADQNTAQENGTFADSAVASSANGDYVVVWTGDDGTGAESVYMRMFDFSGTAIGGSVLVSGDLAFGSNQSANVAMADDGSFVVVWSNATDLTAGVDGTVSSIYFQRYDANGTAVGVSERVTDAGFSAGEQVNADVSMNASGQFAITWDGAGGGGTHNVFANVYDTDGTSITSGAIRTNGPSGGFEFNASVVMADDGTTITMWDAPDGLHARAIDNTGTLLTEFTAPLGPGVLEARHSSIDFDNASGLFALAYEVRVSDGVGGFQWETYVEVVDPLSPASVYTLGNQTTVGDQTNASVNFGSDGTILMTWQGTGSGDVDGVFGRKFRIEFDGSGNPFAQATSDEFLINETTSGTQAGASIAVLDSHNYVVAWSGEGVDDPDGIFVRQFGNQSGLEISGVVVEDVNGDADLSDAIAFDSATVKLYIDNDGVAGASAGDRLVREVQTDASGNYSFTGLSHDNTYFVVVDSKTIESSGTFNSGYTFEDSWAEQTYGNGGAMIGGLNAGVSDNASSLLTAEHLSQVTIVRNDVANVDFGFSFNVVSNSDGGDAQDDDAGTNERSVQGSVRQFITNANAIDGDNHMRFVPGTAADINDIDTSGNSQSRWELAVFVALPSIEDAGTFIDGRAYDTDGVTLLNSNTRVLGYVGSVGVGADGVDDGILGVGDEGELLGVEAPELEITDWAGVDWGLDVKASDTEIAYIAIHGFGQSGTVSGNILVDGTAGSVSNVKIHDNVIGAAADEFAAGPTAVAQTYNIYVAQADAGEIQNNLIGFGEDSGIKLAGKLDLTDGANNWLIHENEIRSNATLQLNQDGIDLTNGSSNAVITSNLIIDNSGYGIDSHQGGGAYYIANNTIAGNGLGGNEIGGVRLFGAGSTVEFNDINSNLGAGVHVIGEYDSGSVVFDASTGNLISRNSFGDNDGLAIDLSDAHTDSTIFNQGDGVSDNATASDVNAGNDGLDHPLLTDAYIESDGLHVVGVIDSSLNVGQIEFYVAESGTGDLVGPTAFGEGAQFLASIARADLVSYNGATGVFEALISTPGAGWPTELLSGGAVTAVSIQNVTNNTSEFSNTEEVNVAPVAVDSSILATENQPYTFGLTDFEFTDGNDLEYVSIIIDQKPSGGDLFLDGVKIENNDIVLASQIDTGLLTYQPDLGESGLGYDDFKFLVSDGQLTSDDDAEMTIDVADIGSAPVFTTDRHQYINEGEFVVGNIAASDPDGDSVLYSIVGGPDEDHFVIDSTTGELKFDPTAPDFESPMDSGEDNTYRVRIAADDGDGEIETQLVRVHVQDVNENPTALDDVFAINEGTTNVFDVTANDDDPEPFPLQVTIIDGPDYGTAFVNPGGDVVYVHDGSEVALDGFTYQITDQGGLIDTASVVINVTLTEDPTKSVSDLFGTVYEESITIDKSLILANDIDDDSLVTDMNIVVTSSPVNGTVSMVGGNLVFTPNAGFAGRVGIQYHVDADGVSGNSAVVFIDVAPPAGSTTPDVDDPDPSPDPVDEGPTGEDPGGPADPGDDEEDPAPITVPTSTLDDQLANTVGNDNSVDENEDSYGDFKIDSLGTTYAYASRIDDQSLASLATVIVTSNSYEEIGEFENTLLGGLAWEDLDSAKREFMVSQLQIGVPAIAASAASFLTVGYLAWIIRGGILLSTFMSSVPAWSAFDIQSVLEAAGGGDESIEQMVDQ